MTVIRENAKNTKRLFYNLLAIIVCLPLPLASNREWAWSLMEAWIFGLFAIWLLRVFQNKTRLPDYWKKCWLPIAALISFAGLSLFQLLPLNDTSSNPISVLHELGWDQHSLDPYATTGHFLKTLAYICLFILTIALVNTEDRIKTVLKTFFLSGVFQAAYGSFMTLSDIEYGFFMFKEHYIGKATGTFINRNNYANYLAMCIAAGTALLLIDLSQQKPKSWKDTFVRLLRFIMSNKMILRIGLAVIVVGIVLSRSRMGNIAFFGSLAIAGILWMILTKRVTRNSIILLTSLILIDVWVVGNWFGLEKVQQRLQNTSTSTETRDEVIRDTLVYIEQSPVVGTGGGTFHTVYPYYKSPDVNGFYNHTHNDYLQLVSEYGFIGLFCIALFVVTGAYNALKTMVSRKNPTMQATGFTSIMVIIALLMHSLVDFNLQIMANAASVTILVTLGWVARHLPTKSHKNRAF